MQWFAPPWHHHCMMMETQWQLRNTMGFCVLIVWTQKARTTTTNWHTTSVQFGSDAMESPTVFVGVQVCPYGRGIGGVNRWQEVRDRRETPIMISDTLVEVRGQDSISKDEHVMMFDSECNLVKLGSHCNRHWSNYTTGIDAIQGS